MTGGEAVIEDIRAFDEDTDLAFASGSVRQIQYESNREGKNAKQEKTTVDVFIRYPSRSVVDMDAVTSKLVTSNATSGIITNNNNKNKNATIQIVSKT